MPIIDTQDARDLDSHLQSFFDSTPAERPHQLRQLFTEKFDFSPATGKVSLAKAPQNVTLPSDVDRIAFVEGINMVYVPLQIPGTTRVRKAEAVAAARIIAGQLGDDMLLLMTNEQAGDGASQLHVILPTFVGSTPALRRMVIERDLPRRTVLQQLSNIYHYWQQKGDLRLVLEEAFNVEAVTRAFFQQYHEVFKRVQGLVRGFPRTEEGHEAQKLFVQTLFNRLMFIYFLSRKGWLKFKGNLDYLAALWKDYQKDKDAKNFYKNRLEVLFFAGLNNEASRDVRSTTLASLIGEVPFLNGGLFDKTTDEIKRSDVAVPDEAIDLILHELFEHYNFTVTESTPLDQEVAVDPEMLGKVFEELVTGRHEKGSYYTPRPVVSFMCREALKGYLQGKAPGLPAEAIPRFVDQHDVSGLNLASAEVVRKALERIKVVDPACGSGAYLLGMMHELVELETALYSEKLLMDTKSLYDLKLRIIEANVYGADIDQFAVNIAMLRLWLSLAIDYESFPPPPLPNLDFKIVCGDSLTAPEPNPSEHNPQYEMFLDYAHKTSARLTELKHQYMIAVDTDKRQLVNEIEGEMAHLRAALEFSPAPDDAVDWRVTFSEVFEQNGGFDVVIANPPYGARVSEDAKPLLKQRYPNAAVGKYDSYRLFVELATNLNRSSGEIVLIVPNTWLSLDSAVKLRNYILMATSIRTIVQLPQDTFGAMVDPIILVTQNVPDQSKTVAVRSLSLRGGPSVISAGDWVSSEDVPVQRWTSDTQKRITLSGGDLAANIREELLHTGVPLGELAVLKQGLIPYLTKAEAAENPYIRSESGGRAWFPYLDGSRCIDAFVTKGSTSFIKYGPWLYAPRDRGIFSGPRLVCHLIRNISLRRRLVGAYLEEEIFSDRNTGIIKIGDVDSRLSELSLTALFNSKLWSWLHHQIHATTYLTFSSIERMPLVNLNLQQASRLEELADAIIQEHKGNDDPDKVETLTGELDNYVFDLYQLGTEERTMVEQYFKRNGEA